MKLNIFTYGIILCLSLNSIAQVGSFGWRNELPKAHHKYTLLYTTDKNTSGGKLGSDEIFGD